MYLWCHVELSPQAGLCLVRWGDMPGETKIPDFYRLVLHDENVVGFEITMDDFVLVDLLNAQGYLLEDVNGHVFSRVLYLLGLILELPDQGTEVPVTGVLEEDVEGLFFFDQVVTYVTDYMLVF